MKTSKMEHQQRESDFCTILDRDSILEIFKHLTPDDLCAVTKTCRKMHYIAGYQFRRKYLKKMKIEIWLKSTGEIDVFPKGKHVTCFMEQIQSISVYDKSFEHNARFPILLQTSFDTGNLKEIAFHKCNFNKLFIEESSKILESVEKVAFYESIGKNNVYDDVLKHCKQLKYLFISNWTLNASSFPQNTYPALKYFECTLRKRLADVVGKCLPHVVGIFLQRNPSLKKLVCHIMAGEQKNIFVQKIAQNTIDVEELYLDFGNCVHHLNSVCQTLNLLSDCNRVKRLEFKLSSIQYSDVEDIDALASVKQLTGLHLASCNLIELLANNSFGNLNILQLEDMSFTEETGLLMAQNLPNLLELYMTPMSENDVGPSIAPFVCFSKKLKKLFVYQCNFKDCIKSISLFNQKRKVLKEACELTLYVGKASSNVVGKYVKPATYDLVNLKLVEIVPHGNAFTIHNPMIRFDYIEL